jgi:hypothetical protein
LNFLTHKRAFTFFIEIGQYISDERAGRKGIAFKWQEGFNKGPH